MAFLTVVLSLFLLSPSAAASGLPLSKAPALDFRIEVGRERYLLRISRPQLERVSEALAFGRPMPSGPDSLVVREDQYPPQVSRRVPAELARRATALWRFVQDRGWTDATGIEWDPELGRGASSPNPEGLRDALADTGSRAGVWTAAPAQASEVAGFRVRCVEPLTGPSRCYRVWKASDARRAEKKRPAPLVAPAKAGILKDSPGPSGPGAAGLRPARP